MEQFSATQVVLLLNKVGNKVFRIVNQDINFIPNLI